MHSTTRRLFPYVALLVLIGLTCWALWFGAQESADFVFNNGTEIESADPTRVTGTPEGRIVRALFEGLFRPHPETLEPQPAMAISADPAEILSEDGRTYTFTIRKNAMWTDGTPVTAHDFCWSWQRLLHPETGSQYSFILSKIVNAEKYSAPDLLEAGDLIEIELPDRKKISKVFSLRDRLFGTFIKIEKPPEPTFKENATSDEKDDALAEWREQWVFHVTVDGTPRRFSKKSDKDGVEPCLQVLLDFSQVGVKAPDDDTLEVELTSSTPYFLYLMQFYPAFPANRKCVEAHGFPAWTLPENMVSNGPFVMKYRRIRDRIRMVKNTKYWNAENVHLDVVDAVAVSQSTTALNMYLSGQLDWTDQPPSYVIPKLAGRDDYYCQPSLIIYFYRVNVTREPFNLKATRIVDGKEIVVDRGKLVRQALNHAINKKEICEKILRGGQQPARSIVPPGLAGYQLAECGAYDVKKARQLLVEAGFPEGRGCPQIELLFNNHQDHKRIAENIAESWQKNLGIRVEPRSLEWASYQMATKTLNYGISRTGWVGDYPDPNTFLDLFITDGLQNETGWGNAKYDQLIESAGSEEDPQRRMELLHDAEVVLMDELPVIPIYSYVSINLVKPYIKGFYSNAQDLHPLISITVDQKLREKMLRDERQRSGSGR